MEKASGRVMAGIFLLSRLFLFILMPYSAFLGFGDQLNFYRLAQLPGWPFFHYWVEFPPFFPFLSAGLYRLAGGNEHIYCYLLAGLLTLFDAGTLLVFSRLLRVTISDGTTSLRLIIYTVFLGFFPYGWWYFDPISVFFLLLSLLFVFHNQSTRAGFAIAVGFLWKFFPILALIPAWMTLTRQKFLKVSLISVTGIAFVIGFLYFVSPQMTSSSLSAQYAKGSWQTVWALLDGNHGTGNFGPLTDRQDPSLAYQKTRNPSVIPPIIPLAVGGFAGLLLLRCVGRPSTPLVCTAVTGAAWGLLILAAPGWSPQWSLYIIPLILLALPIKQAVLFLVLLISLCLAEWPLLFSRGRDDLIWIVIVLRTVTTIGLGLVFSLKAAASGKMKSGFLKKN